jgi:trimeric autotransporter adhesin
MVVTDGTGELRYNSAAVDTMMFPVGDITGTPEYSPAKIILKSGTGNGPIGVRVVNTKHPNDTSASEFLSRYWKVSSSGITNF